MADTLKTYSLICPNCDADITLELSPAALADGGEPIQCPECGEESEWQYDAATDALELLGDDDFDDEEDDDEDDFDDEEDDDEDDG